MLTPLIKYRICRDNIRVATGAMEMRGGNGYVEEWVNARLVLQSAVGLATEVASRPELEPQTRRVATALYHAASAVLLAWEASRMDDARRALVADLVSRHRLGTRDPLAVADEADDAGALELLLGESAASMQQVASLLS